MLLTLNNNGNPGTILYRCPNGKMAVFNRNMYMSFSLPHDAIWLFCYRFGDNKEQHNLQYSKDSDIYVNNIEVLTYVVYIHLCQLDNNFPRTDTFHIHTL